MQYQLINETHAHAGPIRSSCVGPLGEIVTGCQADAPCIRRWTVAEDGSVEEFGEAIQHDHWVTALTSRLPGVHPSFPEGCIVSGCMDTFIRVFDSIGNPILLLPGHSKGVVSFSWTAAGQLISGSWDGTARIWELSGTPENVTGVCVAVLDKHENGVQVLGLPNGSVVTTSTGESVNERPANFKLRIWSQSDWASGRASVVLSDHLGPIRSVTAVPGVSGFATSSNDGSVCLRSADGAPIGSMFHAAQEDGSPPFILNCCSLGDNVTVSCGEDGSVMVWNGTEPLQSIVHPKCVWLACALRGASDGMVLESDAGSQDFVTCGHDGILRLFSMNPVTIALAGERASQLQMQFEQQVAEAVQRNKRGPSAEEISKAAKWEARGSHPGKSDGQVMVFNKDGRMIAAQWTAASGAWMEIGEVTGSGDGGLIEGVMYDHVMPVEIETPGGLRSLSLGYNNMENPFDAAQRFIEQNGLGNQYLRQIADWIVARGGNQAPTLGVSGGASSGASASSSASAASAAPSRPSYQSIPLKAFATHDDVIAGFLGKIMPKITEFNGAETENRISDSELEGISALISTLSQTSYYHSSSVSPVQITAVIKMTLWPTASRFPSFDLARLLCVHPNGSKVLSEHRLVSTVFRQAHELLSLPAATAPASSVLCAVRFLGNCHRFDEMRNAFFVNVFNTSLTTALLTAAKSNNKQIRGAIANLLSNIALSASRRTSFSDSDKMSWYTAVTAVLLELFVHERESDEVVFKVAATVGTMALLGGRSVAMQLRSLGFQPEPIEVLRQAWGSRLRPETVACLAEAVAAVMNA